MGDKSSGEGPPPPSPLTGAYLLVVLPQTHQPPHKDYVIHNLTKGFLTWDKTDCHVDLEKELQTITAQAPEGEEAKNGERLIQFASENLVTEVLIHPQLNTLVQCMRNLLSSFTRHRHIIHAGYTCAGNGAWMLQDGTYSYADFAEMYQEHEVQRVLRAYENTVSVDIHCLQEGDWNNLKGKDPFSKVSRVRLNPKDCMISTPAIKGFLDYLAPYVTNGSIDELLESSDVVGNIRFSHPTLYVFPGGQGDAALFGINGFNMLVDGGFARKACFWDFSRHLDRLDAVLMTRINNGNIQGMTSLLQRKRMDHVYPQIGHFFCNMQERRHPLSPDGDKDRDPLLVNLFDQGQDILGSLRHLQLKHQPCYRDPVLEPVNLYHKVGHGKLDMYVISPAKDSREVRDFMAKWTTQDTKIFCSFTKRGGEFNFPLCNKVSICALLVWQPANPEDNITRLLFPGSTPQHKIFEGLDKLKNLEFMKHAVCSARTLSPSSSSVGLNVRTVSKPKVPASVDKIIENDEKKIEAVKQPIMKPPIGQTEKQPPKSQPPVRPPSKQKPAEKPKEKPKTEVEVMKIEKTETVKIEKAKPDKIEKTEAVQKIDKTKEKPKRPITKQPEKKKPVGGEKKDSLKSSPTTPKKSAENKISETQPKPEVKSRASSRTKPSPSATPAKSAKEANNRKVLEQKKEATKRVPPPKKEEAKRAERSTAPRKSVPSPSKTDKQQVSPVKGPRPVIKPKQDAKKIVKVEKDVVTESVASTPSTVDVELAKTKEDSAEKEKKVEEIKVAKAAETSEQPSLSKDEEDEILVIEKIEIEGDGKGKPEESIAVHIRNSREDIIGDDEVVKDEANADLPSDEKKEIMKTSDITIPDTDSKQFSEDVQDITKDAPDTSKSRVEFMTTEEASITKEPATDKLTPKEKDGKEKSTDIGDIKQTDESQPDEKFSTTIESGATTAPTLPEDERIPLDEIKEIIEEKYIKEETKEKDFGVAHRPEQPTSLPEVPVISSTPFDQRVQLLKDIVKTPDEVADLPVHEEADGGIFGVDETQLARDLHRSRDDLLGILAPKKPVERKEDAAEEVKLVKDENEKEDATKDLKEDDIAVEEKAVLSAVTPFGTIDQVDVEKPETPKPEAQLQKLDDNEPALEKMLSGLIDDEALKSSAVAAILDDEEILDEDKDKETEKEKLLPKESRDLDKDEDVADKASKEMLNEKQVAKSVVEEEIKGQKPVPKDGSPEDEKTEADKAVGDQVVSDVVEEIIKPKDAFEVDHKSKSPSPELGVKSDIVLGKKDKSPSPEPKEEKAKEIETVTEASKSPSPKPKIEKVEDIIQEETISKSPSPDLKAGEAEAVTKTSKSPSLDSKVVESKDHEPIVSGHKSPSPEPKDVKAEHIEAPSQASRELKVGETKDAGLISKASKSPSPEPKGVKDEEIVELSKIAKSPSPEPKVGESGDVDSKASKLSSPEPKMDEAKDSEVIAKVSKSPEPEPKVGKEVAKEPKSPSSVPKDDEAIVKAPKSTSPEPKVGEPEAIDKKPKSPSPEPKMEEAKEMGAAVKASKSPSPEPKMEEAKEMAAAVKASKSPSPEPKMEEAKEMAATVKASKSPSPEPKMEEAKEIGAAVKASKSPSPEPKVGEAMDDDVVTKASKSPSPEPKVGEPVCVGAIEKKTKSPSPEPKMEETKEIGAAVKASKSPSPEPKMGEAKDEDAITKASKSPSPEPKVGEPVGVEAIDKKPQSPSPEPKMEEAKEMGAAVKASKSPSPEPKMEESKEIGAAVKASKSPSPEPKMEETKEIGAAVKASKSPSPEPKMGEAKDDDAITKASKSPSPEPKVGVEAIDKKPKSPSPELKMVEAKEMGAAVKASKSPTPEPKMEEAKGGEAGVKSPSPELKAGESAGVETIDKEPKSLSPELETGGAKEMVATVKSSKSPSPVPTIEESEEVKAVVKSPKTSSPEPKMEGVQEIKADAKSSKPSSPELKTDHTKDTDAHFKPPTSPAPEAKDVDELVKASKTPSPEPKVDVSKDIEALAKAEEPKDIEASKSSSPEQKDDLAKSELPDKSSKPTSPECKIEGAKDIDDLIKAPKSPSPVQLADQVRSVELSAISPELIAEEAIDIDGIIKASKSPSPEPKPDDQKTKDSELAGPPSVSLLSESKAEDAKDADSQEKVPKSPPLELKVESLGKLKEIDDMTTSLSLEPKIEPIVELTTKSLDDVEQMKSEKLKDDAKSPSPVLIEEESKTMEPQTLSKSPTPEPKVDKTEIEVLPAKTPISLSSEQKSVDSKVIELPKSPTPEPSTGLVAADPEDELTKSPSPQPDTKASSESADAKSLVSKSSSPEPITEVAKGLEPTTKAHTSPSPEPGKPEEMKVEVSSSPEPKIAASPLPEVAKSDEPKTKFSKSPSPEPMTEMGKSPEPIIKASKSPSPEPVTDAVKLTDQKAATPPSQSLGDVGKLADSLIETTAESPEPSVVDRQSPELQSGAAKDKIETQESKVEDSKLYEPSIKESIKSLEPQTQQSKSPSPEPSSDLQKSPQFGEMSKQALQKEDISKLVELQDSISDSITPESIIGKDSSKLSSQPDKVKSPSPEPQANDLKSTSPLPLGSVDDMINNKDAPGDISTDIKEDVTGKKVKTKEELNQELMEEKEVDEVSEPQRKDLKNLQTKLDGDASSKTTSECQIDSFGDSKAESSKLEAEKHEKEHEVEQDPCAISDDLSDKEDVLSSLEKQIIDEKEINKSLAKKSEESKEMEEASSLEKVKGESKLESSGLGSGMFKTDDRVPSISLREASIEQTSEESAPHKQAEIDEAPGDLEGDMISAPSDRKPSSGEVSTKSTDGDGKTTNDEGRKLSDAGSIGSEISGIVEDALSKMETSVLTAEDIEEEAEGRSKNETYEQKVDRLEKSIAGDREMLRELIKANEESKISTQLELDKSQSASISQGKFDGMMPESSIKDAKVEEVKVDHSLPESIKLEADKDSVEVKSKDDSKDEALVLDLDLPEKLEEVHGAKEDAKRPKEMLESDSKKTVSQSSGTSLVSDTKQVYDELESAKDTIDKTLEPTIESSKQKILDDAADSLQEQPKSESDKVEPVKADTKPETKDGDHVGDKHSPSPPVPHEGKDDGKMPTDVKEDDKAIKDGTDTLLELTKSTGSGEMTDDKDAAIKLQESISPEKSPLMDKKLDSLATIDQDLKSTSSTPEPPSVRDTTAVSGDAKVVDSKVEDVTAEKETEVTSESAKAGESKGDLMKQDLSMITSDESKGDILVESGKAADIEHIAGTKVGDPKEIECEVSKVDVAVSLGSSSTTSSVEPTKAVDEKGLALEKSIEETSVTSKEQLETATSTIIKESSVTGVMGKDVVGSATAATEQLQFATSTVDSKQNLESIEPLVVEESKPVTVSAESITEKDVGEITTAIVTKAEEESPAPKSLAGESTVEKSTTESTGSTKDSTTHLADSFTLLTNGKTSSDIHETDRKVEEDTAVGKEHDVKKSDTRVTDILDTAERIVSSLNGKKTISDEPSDYIPSFSETKSYAITIEGKKGLSDEITVETKTIEESEVVHTDSHGGKEEASSVSKVADAGKKPAETSSITTSQDMNGHSKLHKEDECVLGSSSALKYDAQDKHSEDSQTSMSSVGKLEESISKSGASKDESSAIASGKVETEKLEESSKSVGQSLTKVIGETVATMGDTVSAIGSFLSGDLLRSSTSSAKGSTTASPDLSRKSDDAISSTQHDVAKGISSSKIDLASKESLIDVTSSFLSMESGISQSSEKSADISVSSSKSGDKVTETTDQKSSLSSTQVEPPTEKDQPILHSITAALRTQKDFSRSETPASDILSDRDVEIGHCTPFSDTSSGQVSRAVTHVWETVEGRPESRHYDSDEDIPGSPMSISSHIPSPPQFEYDMSRPQDPMMMSSFYGSLPEDLEEGVKALSGEMASAYDYGIHDKSDISLKKELGDKLSASIRSSLTSTPESSPLPERRFESLLATSSKDPSTAQPAVPTPAQPPVGLPSSSSAPPKPDPIGKWDKPLGLPPPHSTNSSAPYLRWNPYKEWGKPLGLPSPAPPPREDTDIEVDTSGSARTTPKKVSKMNAENNKYSSNAAKEASNKSKRSESPVKKPSGKDSRKSGPTPVYMDLSYVPHHGNSNYATVEFFKRVRARYYVFSGTEPSKEVFNALLEAKQSWEDKDLEVTIIPTYDTDTLGYWIAENEETLSKLKIDLSPSASRCTINLQDHDTSCSAYRLEF